MIIEEGLSIKTTSLCNRWCKHCSVTDWMRQHPDYYCSIEDIEKLIQYSRESDYKWKFIILSGGEPLLWKYIEEGTRLLYRSGITDDVIIFTNALAASENNLGKMGRIIENTHHFRISRYFGSEKQIAILVNKFGNRVQVVDRTTRMVPPLEILVEDSLPAICNCKSYCLVDGYVDACAPARTILCRIEGFHLGDDVQSVKLQKNFLNFYKGYPKYNRKICQYCISNANVQKHLNWGIA